jgi:hypothetical protein
MPDLLDLCVAGVEPRDRLTEALRQALTLAVLALARLETDGDVLLGGVVGLLALRWSTRGGA